MLIAAHLKRLLPAFVLIFHYPSVKTQVTVTSLNQSSEAPLFNSKNPFASQGLHFKKLGALIKSQHLNWWQKAAYMGTVHSQKS